MARGREQHIEHLLRRAAFGAAEEDVTRYAAMPYVAAVERLLGFERVPDDVDDQIGRPGYVGVTARAAGGFQPLTNIDDTRQRWLFRMVHSQRPLQEKMALFWHNHFATAYSKVSGTVGGADATRMFAAKSGEVASGVIGQLELFRQYALGNFRDLLVAVAKDPAMLVWLDGRLNVRGRPAGELRARADGALHDGRRDVSGDRRLRRRAGVHRLEPGAARATRTTRSTTSPARTTPTPRSSRSRSTRTAAR